MLLLEDEVGSLGSSQLKQPELSLSLPVSVRPGKGVGKIPSAAGWELQAAAAGLCCSRERSRAAGQGRALSLSVPLR